MIEVPRGGHGAAEQHVSDEQKQHLAAGNSHHVQLYSILGSIRDPERLGGILDAKEARISDIMRSRVSYVI